RPPACARNRGPARYRCIHHAAHHFREHQRPHVHDRRARRGIPPFGRPMNRSIAIVVLLAAAIGVGAYVTWRPSADSPAARTAGSAGADGASSSRASAGGSFAGSHPTAPAIARRVAAAPVRSTLFHEYLGAKSYRALYDRLHDTAEGTTAEGKYVMYDILRKCATVTDRQYRRGVQAKPLDQRRADFIATLPPNDPNR